jgi:transcriptional regulator with XRE-family HTH domain
MRFQFLKPRRDVASAEQVRALRELRGWTVEQLADEVHASPLEVSAWEAEAVAVPSKQALLIRWHTERVAWTDAVAAARGELCGWARENAPDQYERILRNPAGLRYDGNAPVRAHIDGCGACQAALARARQIGGYPSKPLLGDTFRARYWRWVDRLPRWAAVPFVWAGLSASAAVIALAMLTVDHEAAFGVRVDGLIVGAAFGLSAQLLVMIVARGRITALLQGLAFGAAGLLGWSLVDPSIHLDDPSHWAAALTVGCGIRLLDWVTGRLRPRHKAKALAARKAPRPVLSPPSPDLAAGLERGAPASRQPVVP